MFEKASEFTMKDQSSKPYAWVLEGAVELREIEQMDVEKWVRAYVNTIINAANYSDSSDTTVYKVWRSESGEFDAIVDYIETRIAEEKEEVWVELPIPAAYNAGEFRLSEKVYGKRGGEKFVKVFSTSATGGLQKIRLTEGATYKCTYWVNGWPHCYEITINADGEIEYLS